MNQLVRFWKVKHMKQVMMKAIACGIILLVLPSCGIPPLRHAEPGPGLPTDFNGATSPENSAHLTTRTSRSIDSPPLAWPIRPFAEDAHE